MKDATPNRRLLKISVLRFNPQESGSEPRMQTYEIEEAWLWEVSAYRTAFDTVKRLSPSHYRKGTKLR